MKLHIIETGKFKLDGGAMFGVVPKQMWNRMNPADENNMCTWSMRCLLVVDGNRKILIDTGMGDKQDERFMSHFEPHGDESLITSLNDVGYSPTDITDVFLTHLHFDHCGGAVSKEENGDLTPTFPNAKYWVSETHLKTALSPNYREKASFLKENIQPLIDHDVIAYVEESEVTQWTPNISVKFYNGHTTSMMVPTISLPNGKKLTYPADLLPSSFHVRMPYVMSYDIRPLVTLQDKAIFYAEVAVPDHYIFFEHDPETITGQIIKNGKGRFEIKTANLDDITTL